MKHRDDDHFRIWHSDRRRTTYVSMPLVAFVGGLLLLIFLALMVWSVKRKPDAKLKVTDAGDLRALLPSIAGLTQSSLDSGNRIEVLQNGNGFFPRVMRDVAAARQSIHLESYIWYDGTISRQLAKLLSMKAREGVEVRILVDASGGRQLEGDVKEMLIKAGAQVSHFHPVRINTLGTINNRDHRKLIVIDGRIGYIGGHGIADEWTGNGQDLDHWRDTALRVTGPAVNRMQAAFSENWVETGGLLLAGEKYFPHLPPAGNSVTHVAWTSPSGGVSSVQILYYLAIKAAHREIIIQNPYLLPDDEAIEALQDAVARGVDVKIMVPSDDATDSPVVQHASHHHFGTLLKRGVKIWEYEKTLLHQKVLIVDGMWSSVGSTNFDDRSFDLNDEVNIGVLDPAIAAQLRAAFENDLRHAKQHSFKEWENRGVWHRLIDGLAYLGRSQL
jgi:cardiolipin synthase